MRYRRLATRIPARISAAKARHCTGDDSAGSVVGQRQKNCWLIASSAEANNRCRCCEERPQCLPASFSAALPTANSSLFFFSAMSFQTLRRHILVSACVDGAHDNPHRLTPRTLAQKRGSSRTRGIDLLSQGTLCISKFLTAQV